MKEVMSLYARNTYLKVHLLNLEAVTYNPPEQLNKADCENGMTSM